MGFRFEGLEIFQEAVEFAAEVYERVKQCPHAERYNLLSQVTRAVNSISLNIAEGSGRGTKKEFSRFLAIAIGSCYEAVAGLIIAEKLENITDNGRERLKTEAEGLCKKINSFKRTLR